MDDIFLFSLAILATLIFYFYDKSATKLINEQKRVISDLKQEIDNIKGRNF